MKPAEDKSKLKPPGGKNKPSKKDFYPPPKTPPKLGSKKK